MVNAKLVRCGHCGKPAVFHERASGTKYGEVPVNPFKSGYDFQTVITWRVMECVLCAKPTLVEETVDYNLDRARLHNLSVVIDSAETRVLYPETAGRIPLTNLPIAVEKAYKGALAVQDIEPNLCAVAAGRTLEAICNHEQVKGKDLKEKLNNLAEADRIPKTLAEMARQLRQIRNLGAHAAEVEITGLDIPIILHFVEAILEYLYVAPAKIAAVEARLKQTP